MEDNMNNKNSNKKREIKNYLITGILLLLAGVVFYILFRLEIISFVYLKEISFLMIFAGLTISGYFGGELIRERVLSKDSIEIEQVKIEQNDERNIQIEQIAKSRGFNLFTIIFGAALFCVTVLDYITAEGLVILIGAYIGIHLFMTLSIEKLKKTM